MLHPPPSCQAFLATLDEELASKVDPLVNDVADKLGAGLTELGKVAEGQGLPGPDKVQELLQRPGRQVVSRARWHAGSAIMQALLFKRSSQLAPLPGVGGLR